MTILALSLCCRDVVLHFKSWRHVRVGSLSQHFFHRSFWENEAFEWGLLPVFRDKLATNKVKRQSFCVHSENDSSCHENPPNDSHLKSFSPAFHLQSLLFKNIYTVQSSLSRRYYKDASTHCRLSHGPLLLSRIYRFLFDHRTTYCWGRLDF